MKSIFLLPLFLITATWLLMSPVTAVEAGYPKIYNLWGGYNYGADNAFFASFNLYSMYSDGSRQIDQDRADAIHALNPNTLILVTADIIPAHDPGTGLDTQPQWWSALPGTPDYACILRDSAGNILRDTTYQAAYNNLTNSYCRDVLVNHFLNRWNASGGHFNGWQVDQAGDTGVSWSLGNNIDANVDGVPDNSATVDAAYTAGMIDIFTRLRTALPEIIIHANDSPAYYGTWINGRLYEMDLKRYLDKTFAKPWLEIIKDWSYWTSNQTQLPNSTGVMNSPPSSLISSKYNFQNIWSNIKPAMMAEYSADYNRMRFGLASALMAGGMYSYDLSSYMYGVNWWYDEYGTLGNISSLGYLGQPTDLPNHISHFTSPNQVVNGDFNSGTEPWFTTTSGSSLVATYTVEAGVARLNLNSTTTSGWAAFRQNYVQVETDKYYTISFRARANNSRYGGIRIQRAGGAWEYLTEAKQIRFYPEWTQYYVPLKASGTGTNGTLFFDLGTSSGDIYFDEIKFQEGVGGIWQRHFDQGTVLLNESPLPQTVTLDQTYQKLQGNQAPLYSKRLDNDQAVASGSWSIVPASFDEWGTTVHTIPATETTASLTYSFNLPYSGEYEVLAWVAPLTGNSSAVVVSVNGTPTTLNQATGELGWRSLGQYSFTDSATIILRPSGTGQVNGDAIKLISLARYNDGSFVNQVTLQPDDAIILLNASAPPPNQYDFDLDDDVDYLDLLHLVNNFPQSYTIFDFNTLIQNLF